MRLHEQSKDLTPGSTAPAWYVSSVGCPRDLHTSRMRAAPRPCPADHVSRSGDQLLTDDRFFTRAFGGVYVSHSGTTVTSHTDVAGLPPVDRFWV